MSKLPKKGKERSCKTIGDHQRYISRITKTLYYGKFPKADGLSLPVTELAAELFSEAKRGRSLSRLHCDDAAKISRRACVSPCSMVLAILYLERLKKHNPEYLERTAPSDLFLVSLMVSCKFLYDDGEADEVYTDEWANSGEISVKQLVHLEKDFLNAIDWEVYINELTFWKKLNEIEKVLAKRQGSQRGYYTYTELAYLLSTIELHNFIQCIATVSLILVASYTAAVLTLLGSVLIVSHIPGNYIATRGIENHFENKTSLPIFYESSNNHNNELDKVENDVISSISDSYDNNQAVFVGSKGDVKALNILKTGIFLASIDSILKPFCNNNNTKLSDNANNYKQDVQNATWDWWNVPTMQWLSDTADFIENIEFPQLDFNYFGRFLDSYVSKTKYLELEDHIHKATKTRIQDQMETSWHKEWTDTLNDGIYFNSFQYYLQNLKS